MLISLADHVLKEKIRLNPTHHLDLIFDLLPNDIDQAEKILQLMDELVKEKKLDKAILWLRMEEPIYFQGEERYEFTRRGPLVGKMIREGNLSLFNHYLNYKYNLSLCALLLKRHDIFLFRLPPIFHYVDQNNKLVAAERDDVYAMTNQYYDVYGMLYEMLGDVLQEKNMEILKQLMACEFDFNTKINTEHLDKYLYANQHNLISIGDQVFYFLYDHGLDPNAYMDIAFNNLLEGCSLMDLSSSSGALVRMTSFLFDHGAKVSHIPHYLLMSLNQLLEQHANKLSDQKLLEDIWYLQGQLYECLGSFDKAKPYYLKAGTKGGIRAMNYKSKLILPITP